MAACKGNPPLSSRQTVLQSTLARKRTGRTATVADHTMIGKIGRVTGSISPGHIGEVMVSVRGGSEAFHAYAADAGTTIASGSRVVVVEYFPPRTVVVSPA